MTRTATFVVRLPGQTQPQSVRAQLVSGDYFSTLDVPVMHGRPIGRDDVSVAQRSRSPSSANACGRNASGAPT